MLMFGHGRCLALTQFHNGLEKFMVPQHHLTRKFVCSISSWAIQIGKRKCWVGWTASLPLSWTGPKSEQPTFKCNIYFNSTHRTSRSPSAHSKESCEWFGHDFQVLLVKLEQISHLKVESSDFGPVWDRGSLPYLPKWVWWQFPQSHQGLVGL